MSAHARAVRLLRSADLEKPSDPLEIYHGLCRRRLQVSRRSRNTTAVANLYVAFPTACSDPPACSVCRPVPRCACLINLYHEVLCNNPQCSPRKHPHFLCLTVATSTAGNRAPSPPRLAAQQEISRPQTSTTTGTAAVSPSPGVR